LDQNLVAKNPFADSFATQINIPTFTSGSVDLYYPQNDTPVRKLNRNLSKTMADKFFVENNSNPLFQAPDAQGPDTIASKKPL